MGLNDFESLVDYGEERMRALCKEWGIDWDSLSEIEREQLVDDLLHDRRQPVNLDTMLASEPVLRRDWDSAEENRVWGDL